MDKELRNTLRNTVTKCRKLLEDAVGELLEGQFGIHRNGQVEDAGQLKHLAAGDQDYRSQVLAHYEHIKATGFKPADAMGQLIREVSFTHLNRLCAYKLMEKRGLIRESVSRGLKSQGVSFHLADHPEDEKLWDGGQQDVAYRHFLEAIGARFADEIPILFSPHDPANRLFPPQRVLDDVLELLNAEALKDIWTEDETIGWIYQYFTPKELRDQARKESAAPRNSYELAFRNQFFTPRYVVHFLGDNTLGRIWYEMMQGRTRLVEKCEYMVRRPNEVWLKEGEEQPTQEPGTRNQELSQEDILRQSVNIPFRPKKDPRDIKLLDPAEGSGHFLLYGFDLMEVIYLEAWDDPDLGKRLKADFQSLEAYKRQIPELILRHNLHGIDIDLRAVQIAALALWLRAQRAWQEMGIPVGHRPRITRSNLVCAEPMPGETDLLEEFVATLQPRLLGQLVRVIFEKMKLAGEAGSLLKIEEELRDTIDAAKKQWQEGPRAEQMELLSGPAKLKQEELVFDLAGVTDEQFWAEAEERVLTALSDYATMASRQPGFLRRLFADDAARGFAFVDICRKRFDVVLMNPPFGLSPESLYKYLTTNYPDSFIDLLAAFMRRGIELAPEGLVGAITSRACLYTKTLVDWRSSVLTGRMSTLADLGMGVLDAAMVRAAAYVLESGRSDSEGIFIDCRKEEDKAPALAAAIASVRQNLRHSSIYIRRASIFRSIPQQRVLYALSPNFWSRLTALESFEPKYGTVRAGLTTYDDERFLRLLWEVNPDQIGIGKKWVPISKGGYFGTIYADIHLVVNWENDGAEVGEHNRLKYGTDAQSRRGSTYYLRPALTYSRRTDYYSARALPENCFFSDKGPAILPSGDTSPLYLLGIFNSSLFRALVHCQSQGGCFETGVLKQLPWTEASGPIRQEIERLALAAWKAKAFLFSTIEGTAGFVSPIRECARGTCKELISEMQFVISKIEQEIRTATARISELTEQAWGLVIAEYEEFDVFQDDHAVKELEAYALRQADIVGGITSYSLGCVLGRWDVSCVNGQKKLPIQKSPFEPLPSCPPGMLQDSAGSPARPHDIDTEYPILIDWDGILVDDSEHEDDIVRRVREVLAVIWKDRAEAIEQDACEILGVKELRDYFRKSGNGGFWMDHVKRYSKSRRKAPIYWLLQSAGKNYSLWIYYHRLDKDILFKALVKYVEPKLKLERDHVEQYRNELLAAGSAGRSAKSLERRLADQEDLLSDLQDFHDKLRRAANLRLEPDLNDGVVLNIAPLWELVPWKEAKSYWDELIAGEYEWSSIGKQLRAKGIVE